MQIPRRFAPAYPYATWKPTYKCICQSFNLRVLSSRGVPLGKVPIAFIDFVSNFTIVYFLFLFKCYFKWEFSNISFLLVSFLPRDIGLTSLNKRYNMFSFVRAKTHTFEYTLSGIMVNIIVSFFSCFYCCPICWHIISVNFYCITQIIFNVLEGTCRPAVCHLPRLSRNSLSRMSDGAALPAILSE